MWQADDKYQYLVHMTGYTDTSTFTVYRFSTGGFVTAATDSPALTPYVPCVDDVGSLTMQEYYDGGTGTAPTLTSEAGWGSIRLTNLGELDALFRSFATINFRDRPIELYRVARNADGTSGSLASAKLLCKGIIAQVKLEDTLAVVSVKDRTYELRYPHWTSAYGGTNSLPNGVDGAADIAGKTKLKGYGLCYGVDPYLVNTSRLIYQVNDGAIVSAVVRSGGVVVTAGADYTSQSDMETNAPSAGQCRVWPAGGMFRLGSSSTLPITADVTYHSAGSSTVAQIIKQMLLDKGYSAGDINASDITALDSVNSAVCGVLAENEETTESLINRLANTAGLRFGFNRFSVFRVLRFDVAAGASVVKLAQWNTSDIATVTDENDIPALDVRLRYKQYHKRFNIAELAGSLTDAERYDFLEEWRVVSGVATPSPNPYKRTKTLVRDTCYTSSSDASAERSRVAGIVNVPHGSFVARNVFLDDTVVDQLDLGVTAGVWWHRYGFSLSAETKLRVIKVTYSWIDQRCEITLWG